MVKFKYVAILSCVLLAACNGSKENSQKRSTGAPSVSVSSSDQRPAKPLFGHKAEPSQQKPEAYGFYSKGCLSGAIALPENGPTWQAMRLSRNRNYGHPELFDFVKKLSRKAAQQPGWEGLYVGDLSQPRGGPMLSGHASHQIGLDADIWMLPPKRLDLTRAERESISSISLRRAGGAYVNENWSLQHFEIIKAAAKDPRVQRILVFPGAKVKMCELEKGDRAWLRKIRPWWGHHYHFHVRLHCPEGSENCHGQNPVPPGDGCADAQVWVDNILNPPPPDPNAPPPRPRPPITMASLPQQCSGVLSSR